MKKSFKKFPVVLCILLLILLGSIGSMAANTVNNSLNPQALTIKGVVTSGSDKQPIPGVNIKEKSTTNGTVTDVNGKYTITVADANSILEFSFIGFVSQEISAEGRLQINVELMEKIEQLDDVVVVGYGVTKKSDLTSAVASVNIKEMKMLPAQNLGQALQGRASGVDVIRSSGAPGAGSRIYVRGPGSVNGTDPLFVCMEFLFPELTIRAISNLLKF